jgi:multiple sugar transport system permease protein
VAAPALGRRQRAVPYLLLVPSALFLALLLGYPLLSGIAAAFRGPDGGFTTANWVRLAGEPRFWQAVRNTLLLAVVVLPVQFVLALGMALLLQAKPRFSSVYFYVWAVPLAISDLAAGLVWLAIFTDRGYLDSALVRLGFDHGVDWLNYQNQATLFLTVVVAEVWRATALVLIIVVAGLQAIPKDYDEAAQVLGATFWQRLRHVTLPLLRPSLQVALILRTILALEAFAVAQALTGQTFPLLVGETYEWAVTLQNPPVASAIALVVLAMSMVVALVYLRALRQPESVGGAR